MSLVHNLLSRVVNEGVIDGDILKNYDMAACPIPKSNMMFVSRTGRVPNRAKILDNGEAIILPVCLTPQNELKLTFREDKRCSAAIDYEESKAYERFKVTFDTEYGKEVAAKDCSTVYDDKFTYTLAAKEEGCVSQVMNDERQNIYIVINIHHYYTNYTGMKMFVGNCAPSANTQAIEEEALVADADIVNDALNSDGFIHYMDDGYSRRIVNVYYRDDHKNKVPVSTGIESTNAAFLYTYIIDDCANVVNNDRYPEYTDYKKKGFCVAG